MYVSLPNRERYRSAAMSCAFVGLTGWALLAGLDVDRVAQAVNQSLVAFDLTRPPPPKPPEPPHARPRPIHHTAAKDKAGARNLRNKATAIVAPKLPPIVIPPPVIAAPRPNNGVAANTGAANRVGPGQGAGDYGDGNGGGGDGGDGDDTPPEQIAGRFKVTDLPPELVQSARGVRMEVRFSIETSGRVTACRVTSSSGNAALDATACRVVEERYRFRPSLDGAGRPVRSSMVQALSWTMDGKEIVNDRG